MNQALLAQKLTQIATCLEEMKPLLQLTYAEFSSDAAHFRLAERDVQLIVDSAIDINNHLLLEAGRTPPATYYDSFVGMGASKILAVPCARRLAGTAGLRNRIVHQYESVDLRILHRALRAFMRDYGAFCGAVRKHAGL